MVCSVRKCISSGASRTTPETRRRSLVIVLAATRLGTASMMGRYSVPVSTLPDRAVL